MKKTAMLASALFLFLTAAVNAQTEPQTTTTPVVDTVPANTDKYNNWHDTTYKLKPMPEALTTDKIFPVIGKFQLTGPEGTASDVTISLDESNKGLVWVEGLPEGKFKAQLRKSPSTYRILPQKLENEKNLPEGVMIYDKDANTMNICMGCKYEVEDPGAVFAVTDEVTTDTEKTTKKNTKSKVAKVKTTMYSGVKLIEAPEQAVATPISQ